MLATVPSEYVGKPTYLRATYPVTPLIHKVKHSACTLLFILLFNYYLTVLNCVINCKLIQ